MHDHFEDILASCAMWKLVPQTVLTRYRHKGDIDLFVEAMDSLPVNRPILAYLKQTWEQDHLYECVIYGRKEAMALSQENDCDEDLLITSWMGLRAAGWDCSAITASIHDNRKRLFAFDVEWPQYSEWKIRWDEIADKWCKSTSIKDRMYIEDEIDMLVGAVLHAKMFYSAANILGITIPIDRGAPWPITRLPDPKMAFSRGRSVRWFDEYSKAPLSPIYDVLADTEEFYRSEKEKLQREQYLCGLNCCEGIEDKEVKDLVTRMLMGDREAALEFARGMDRTLDMVERIDAFILKNSR